MEMLATVAILAIVASVILPVAKTSHKRLKEGELRHALREIRTAIDLYHNAVLAKLIGGMDVKLGSEGYPPNLETLVEGVNRVGAIDRKIKFLRRIPVDPMTGTTEWGLRCYQDEPDSTSWCGDNVWDVYTKSDGKALDGTRYLDW
ncbi:MAG: type II secretion system protein [Vicinamibacteria bacterium]|nr:type II secretion system protein [Vicinamibacteria bacterium]